MLPNILIIIWPSFCLFVFFLSSPAKQPRHHQVRNHYYVSHINKMSFLLRVRPHVEFVVNVKRTLPGKVFLAIFSRSSFVIKNIPPLHRSSHRGWLVSHSFIYSFIHSFVRSFVRSLLPLRLPLLLLFLLLSLLLLVLLLLPLPSSCHCHCHCHCHCQIDHLSDKLFKELNGW